MLDKSSADWPAAFAGRIGQMSVAMLAHTLILILRSQYNDGTGAGTVSVEHQSWPHAGLKQFQSSSFTRV